jgi:ribokinase
MDAVHCLGVLVVDALSGPIKAYPVPGVTPQVNTEHVKFLPGGGAANTSCAIAQMGVSVGVFSKVGRDSNGAFVRAELERNGVDVSQIREAPGESTPFTFVGVHPNGERSFIHTPGCNLTFSSSDLDLDQLYRCRILVYQDFWVLPELDGPSAGKILAAARERGVMTILDECYGLGPRRDIFEAALPHCDVVLPSYDDMRVIYPGLGPGEVGAHLRQQGARQVVLKMGREGCLVSTAKADVRLASVATKIVDTTGAGDCFDAGCAAALLAGLDLVGAAKVGGLAAAACIRNVGGAVGIPKYATLIEALL